MRNLLPGIRNFSFKIFPKYKDFFNSLAQGQKPHTLLITCADSRIDPTLVTQSDPGELFILRNTGNIIPAFNAAGNSEEAGIEFAVNGLGIKQIVVCGHSQCGAMSAILNEQNANGDLVNVHRWLKSADATRKMISKNKDITLQEVIEQNTLIQVDNLKTHPSVATAIKENRINIFAWVYNFESGCVTLYDPKEKRYVPSTEIKEKDESDTSRFAL